MAELVNILEGVVVGEYGKAIALVLKDGDGTVQDISSYDQFIVNLRSPENSTFLHKTATLLTDGTDGTMIFSFTDGNEVKIAGDWEGTADLDDFGSDSLIILEHARTYKFIMRVQPAVPSS